MKHKIHENSFRPGLCPGPHCLSTTTTNWRYSPSPFPPTSRSLSVSPLPSSFATFSHNPPPFPPAAKPPLNQLWHRASGSAVSFPMGRGVYTEQVLHHKIRGKVFLPLGEMHSGEFDMTNDLNYTNSP